MISPSAFTWHTNRPSIRTSTSTMRESAPRVTTTSFSASRGGAAGPSCMLRTLVDSISRVSARVRPPRRGSR
ncbi:hypothetical protein D3C83_164400 [compost metagenome]